MTTAAPVAVSRKMRISNAIGSKGGSSIGQNVIPTSRGLRRRTYKESTFTDDPDSATVSIGEDYIFPAERLQKRQRRTSFVDATQSSLQPIPTIPQKSKPNRRNRFVAPSWSEAGLFKDVQRDSLPI